MRHLDKIVFINSANIPYAEVMLDGNVHFAGTQGVGKSTVLRALLFFYNADKMRLGIQQGQKSFDEFYFRYSNSFIVYQVRMDHGFYSILTYRSQGKVVFRFIDAPYDRAWFVDDSGRVESDWTRIRSRIGASVDVCAKVDTYEQYRNIIFGNTHDRNHRFDKYAIVQSSKYQNIPRSIQNVFLNSKLDADFVKNTIIQSMTEAEDSIQLQVYRHMVADFEQEFDDIDCWYRKNANGQVTVRTKADKVVQVFRLLGALDYEMRTTWHQINHVVAATREQLPLAEDEVRGINDRIAKIVVKIEGTQREYESEHDRLTKEIGKLEQRLDDIRKQRKYYDGINIRAIIQLNDQEPVMLTQKEQKLKLLRALEEQYKDVTLKYHTLYARLDDEWARFDFALKEESQRMRDAMQADRDKRIKERDQRKKAVETVYNDWLSASDERMADLNDRYNKADKRLYELQYWHPMDNVVQDCKKQIQDLAVHGQELESQLLVANNSLKALQNEWDLKAEQITNDYERRRQESLTQLQALKDDLAGTEALLGRLDGSLYQWLAANKPGWEDNIGRVVDEQQVLYAQGLEPRLADGDGSIFGVSINLEAVPAHHRTPDDYRELLKVQQAAVAAKGKEITDLQAQCGQELAALGKSYKGRIAGLHDQANILRVQLAQIPTRTKDAETRLRMALKKEEDMVAAERDRRTKVYNEALLAVDAEKSARSTRSAKRDKDLKAADSEYNAALRQLQAQLKALDLRQSEEREKKKRDIGGQRLMLQGQERDELKGKGADTKALDLCRHELAGIQAVLDRINEQRPLVFGYRKDEDELFSHESEFRDQKRQLEAKDAAARTAYDDKRKRYDAEKSDREQVLKARQSDIDAMRGGLKQYDQLCNVENILPQQFADDDATAPSTVPLGDLVVQMRGAVNKKRQQVDELKRATNSFNSHFGAGNIFKFVVPQSDDDYLKFALNLQEFIENDKIETYRKRVSESYNNILHSVSREVGMLMNHSAQIRGIINEVNRNFQERNFAGVIRSIELRAEESSDRMVLLLRQIRDFTVENALNIGELNLFSGEDRDRVNEKVVDYLKRFTKLLQSQPSRTELTLSDTFRLQFRVQENDNNTGWVERISNVGSDGTDILVKAMVNIMLIDVFKTRAARKNGDFIIHCMMDEIGKLHPSNVSGILQFANARNIYLINSSPMGYNADLYKYNYLLTKDGKSQTHIKRLVTVGG